MLLLLVAAARTPFLAQGQRQRQRQRQRAYSAEVLRHDRPRPIGNGVLDLTERVLTRRETNRLARRIRGKKRRGSSAASNDIDIELVIVAGVEHGYTPKELATHLLNAWKLGSQSQSQSQSDDRQDEYSYSYFGGMLILLVMEDNRIEIEVSDSLAHVFGADWCHEVLYTRVVPWFKRDLFDRGLEDLLEAIEDRWREVRRRSDTNSNTKRKRKRPNLVAALAGGIATQPLWRNWFGKNNNTNNNNDDRGYGYGDAGDDHGHDEDDPGRDHPDSWDMRQRWKRHRGSSWFPYWHADADANADARRDAYRYGYRRRPSPLLPPPLLSGMMGSMFSGWKRGGVGIHNIFRPTTTTTTPPIEGTQQQQQQQQHHHRKPRVTPITTSSSESSESESSSYSHRSSDASSSERISRLRQRLQHEAARRKQKQKRTDGGRLSPGWGGGATWNQSSHRRPGAIQKTPFGTSSGFGGGASWSTSTPNRSSRPTPSSAQRRDSSSSSSSNGGGASW